MGDLQKRLANVLAQDSKKLKNEHHLPHPTGVPQIQGHVGELQWCSAPNTDPQSPLLLLCFFPDLTCVSLGPVLTQDQAGKGILRNIVPAWLN